MTREGVLDLAPASFSATCAHAPALCEGAAIVRTSATQASAAASSASFDDAKALRMLQRINEDVNRAMAQNISLLINAADEWSPAAETADGLVGDCKSFAAEKRRRLIAAGFPAERLFYAVVFREDIGLHALLMARLDGGDYAIDSRDPRVMPWQDVDYLYVERQAAGDPYRWTNLVAPPQAVARVLMPAAVPLGRPQLKPAVLSIATPWISPVAAAPLMAVRPVDAAPPILLVLAVAHPDDHRLRRTHPGARLHRRAVQSVLLKARHPWACRRPQPTTDAPKALVSVRAGAEAASLEGQSGHARDGGCNACPPRRAG